MPTVKSTEESDALSIHQKHMCTKSVPIATPVTIEASDGYFLGGVLYEPAGAAIPPCAVVLNSGGGIPTERYSRFATYVATHGIPILTYDYRGIGASRPRRLRGFVATAEDWSELDCSGAIAWLRVRYPGVELVGLAHSVGAMLFGAATNCSELARLVFLGAHTGYYGDYAPMHRLPMAILWHGVMPVLTRAFGYFPGRLLHLGEDIPAGVALQWASRRNPEVNSELDGPGNERTKILLSRYAEIRLPTYAMSFADDAFATSRGTQRLLGMYSGVVARHDVVDPAALGSGNIGHFGFFRRSNAQTLWPMLLPFLLSSSFARTLPAA